MTYRVELTDRAERDLDRLYRKIKAAESSAASAWFNGLEAAVLSLDENPARGAVTQESASLRHLLYRSKSYTWRIIYKIDEARTIVHVLHIRHGSRKPM